MKNRKFVTATLLAAGILALAACGGAGVQETLDDGDLEISSGTIRVSPANTVPFPPSSPSQWFFLNESPSGGVGIGSFVNGPATPPIGTGSVSLFVNGTGRMNIGTLQFAGTRFRDLRVLRYSTYVDSASHAVNNFAAPSLQLEYDADSTDSNTAFQGRLVYEPYYSGTVTPNIWQTWDTLQGKWWASPNTVSPVDNVCPQSNPCTVAQIRSQFPNLIVNQTTTGAPLGRLLIRMGGPVSNTVNVQFTGNADRLVIRRAWESANTVFNFELDCGTDACPPPAVTPTTLR